MRKPLERDSALCMRFSNYTRVEEEGILVDAQDEGWSVGPQLRWPIGLTLSNQ